MNLKPLSLLLLALWSWSSVRAERPIAVFLELDAPAIAEPESAETERPGARPATVVPPMPAARLAEIRRQQAALEPLLAPLEAKVTGRFATLVNALRVRVPESRLAELRALPGVRRVQRAHLFRPHLETSVPWVGGPAAWSAPAGNLNGNGVRLGIIDSGIDYHHAHFGGSGLVTDYDGNDPTVIEPGTFPTAKVVGGTDFVGDDYDASGKDGSTTLVPDSDPLDPRAHGHGSHVAGIAAGFGVRSNGTTYGGLYDTGVDFTKFKVGPGIAPKADLYALKVFGRKGSSVAVTDALEWAADPNGDGRTTDHLDVVNLSLGDDFGFDEPDDVELKAVDRLARLGCVVVISAGNAGDTCFIVGHPGIAARAVTVANSIDDGTATFALNVTAPAVVATNYTAVEGEVTAQLAKTGPKTAQVVATIPANACGPLQNTAALKGKLALIDRGGCFFTEKLALAQAAGAIGVIMVNHQAGPPIVMGGDAVEPITIPGVMISKADGDILKAQLARGLTATLSDAIVIPHPELADQLEESSSRGPVLSTSRLKPDLAAPGSNIRSAKAGAGADGVVFSGTSMSAPHVAGAAVLLKQAHPTWPVDDLKAALMNTALPMRDAESDPYPASRAGAGRLQVGQAAATQVVAKADNTLGEVSLAFGAHELAEPFTVTRSLRLVNHGGTAVTLDLSVSNTVAEPGITLTPSVPSVTVPANGAVSVGFRLDADPSKFTRVRDLTSPAELGGVARPQLPESSGAVWFHGPGPALHVPWHIIARAASRRAVTATDIGLPAGAAGTVRLPSRGPSAHPAPLVAAFQLGLTDIDERFTDQRGATDVVAIGAASDFATAGLVADTRLYFGIAVAGHWLTPTRAANDFDVELDLDDDGLAEFTLINGNTGTFAVDDVDSYGDSTDALETIVREERSGTGDLTEGGLLNLFRPEERDAAVFLNGVLVHSALARDLGLSTAASKFRYRVLTRGDFFDTTAWANFDAARPALDGTARGLDGTPFFAESTGVTLGFNRANAAAAGFTAANPPRALLLHLHNLGGRHHELVRLDLATADADADGLADAEELERFGDLDHNGATDSDGDGFPDLEELLAGTDPLDAGSAFRLGLKAPGGVFAGVGIRWPSATGHTYAVERAETLPGPFTVIRAGLSATPPQNEFNDATAVGAGPFFYRVRVE